MGQIPCKSLFNRSSCLALALLTAVTTPLFAIMPQSPPTQPVATIAQARKPLTVDQLPAEARADILMARGEYAAAISAYQQGNLKSAVVWNNIGMAYHHLFALDEARRSYEHALSINPRFAPAANNLAAVYYGQHDLSEAVHWYKKALKHTSESAVTYCNLGTAYFAEARYKDGIKAYRKAFAIDQEVFSPKPNAMVEAASSRTQRIEMNYFVAETYARVGQQEQALTALRKAMDEGFRDRKRLIEDKDFASLRTTPEFQKLLSAENLN